MKNTHSGEGKVAQHLPAQVVKADELKDSDRVEQLAGFESCRGFTVVLTDDARYQVGSTCRDGVVLAVDFDTVRIRRWDGRILTVHVFQGPLPTPVPDSSPQPPLVGQDNSSLAMGGVK